LQDKLCLFNAQIGSCNTSIVFAQKQQLNDNI